MCGAARCPQPGPPAHAALLPPAAAAEQGTAGGQHQHPHTVTARTQPDDTIQRCSRQVPMEMDKSG